MSTVPLKPVTADFVLADVDTSSHPGVDKKSAEKELLSNHDTLADLQERLFAESKFGGTRSVLLVLQAMDTAGKGGIIRHVVGGIDPQGVHIHAFKAPTEEERKHDFLWRVRPQLPTPGIIGVFDRSHYEDVLIHRVRGFSTPEAIEERYGIITDFESEVAAAGTTIIKVMLHISSAEQKAGRQALEVQPRRCRRAQALARLSGGVSDRPDAHVDSGCAVVRRARRQQVVRALGRAGPTARRPAEARPPVAERRLRRRSREGAARRDLTRSVE